MEIKHWQKQASREEKDTLGWKSIQQLENDIHEAKTILTEEDVEPELREALRAQVRANRVMRQALVHVVTETSAN